MSGLFRTFAAERVKWRKNWPLLVAILAPLCQLGFLALLSWYSEERIYYFKPGFMYWTELNCIVWNLVFMPIAVALIAQLSWQQEAEAKAWNLLLIQPLPRRSHYLAKCLGHLSLVLLSQILLWALLLPIGLILRKNPLLYMGPVLWEPFLKFAGYSLVSFIPVVMFHTWLSIRFPGLWVALGTAMMGVWVGTQWVGAAAETGIGAWIQLFPWGLNAHAVILFERWRILPWAYIPGALLAAGIWIGFGLKRFARQGETA